MRNRYVFAAILLVLVTLVVWQISFKFEYVPTDATQTFLLMAVSTVIFILTIWLLARLIKTAVKLYLERQSGREGSRIKSKLVFGALALSLVPVVFLFLFGRGILNRALDKWFSAPADDIRIELTNTSIALGNEVQGRAQALANWLSVQPGALGDDGDLAEACAPNRIAELSIEDSQGVGQVLCQDSGHGDTFTGRASLAGGGRLVVSVRPSVDLAETMRQIQRPIERLQRSCCPGQVLPQIVHAVPDADRSIYPVRGHLDRAGSGAADQRADLGAAGSCGSSAQRQPEPPRFGEGESTSWRCWSAPSMK